MDTSTLTAQHNAQMQNAISYIVAHYNDQPSLQELAEHIGLSETHFQRVFTEWVGVSPKRFLQVVTRTHARQLLAQGGSTLEVTYETGLSSPSRLQDLFVTMDGLTPAQVRKLGDGMCIVWGYFESVLGASAAAWTGQGICRLVFGAAAVPELFSQQLKQDWPAANLLRDDAAIAQRIAPVVAGQGTQPLHVRGTNFQVQVWQALLNIPGGQVSSYGSIAQWIGRPKACRAVGSAVGDNPVSVLIPCHRVIRESGALGGYAWGLERKVTLLGREWSHPSRTLAA